MVRAGAGWRSRLDEACAALNDPRIAVWLRVAGLSADEVTLLARGVAQRGHPRLAIGTSPENAKAWGYAAVHLSGPARDAASPSDLAGFGWSTCAAHNASEVAAARALGVHMPLLSPVAEVAHKRLAGLPAPKRAALLAGAGGPLGGLGGVHPDNALALRREGFAALATFSAWRADVLDAWLQRPLTEGVAGGSGTR